MVLSYIRDDFPINLCGVEDSVNNYQTYLYSCFAVMVFESYGILFPFLFRFVTQISISLMNFILNSAFTHTLFSLRILLLAVEMSDRQAFLIASQTNGCHGPYIGSVSLHILF